MNVTPRLHDADMCDCPSHADLFSFIDDQIDGGRWAVSGVGVGPPGQSKWLYTVGLLERFRHPELVVVGACCPECAAWLLNRLGDRIAEGERFEITTTLPIELERTSVHLRPVRRECWDTDWFAVWKRYYDTRPYDAPPAKAMQVVVPDERGRFPWEPACDPELAAAQQMPDAPLEGPPMNRADRRRAGGSGPRRW
jgi:hypothetical protein